MKSNYLLVSALSSIWVFSFLTQPLSAQFEELAGRLPTSTNAIVMVNASNLFNSGIAKKQGWNQNRESRFATGLSAIPPNASKVLIAASMDWEFMHARWQAELVEFKSAPSLEKVAKAYDGKLDKISDTPAVALPNDSYILQLTNNLFGVMAPANRQVVSRWIRQSDASLSPYIQAGVAYEDKGSDIIIAFDLHDMISKSAVEQKLAASKSEAIKNSNVDKSALADVLSGIRGMMLGITFGEKANGAIRVDFSKDASILSEIGKPLLLYVLGQQGIMIDEFVQWDAKVEGKSLQLRGELSYSGLTRIASLIEPPAQLAKASSSQASNQQPTTDAASIGQTTQAYYSSINKLFKDLKSQKRDAANYYQIGYFYGKYAQKISELPILNVDPEMVKFADYVSGHLHSASDTIKGVGIRTGPQQNQAADSVTGAYRYGGSVTSRFNGVYGISYGGVAYSAQLESQRREHARIQVAQNNRAQGNTTVTGILSQIDDAKLTIRRAMTEKYKIEF